MPPSQIPEKLVNFACYAGTGALEFLGMTDIDLPKLESMTDTIHGAGIAGEYDSPTIGHFKAMVVKLAWRTTTEAALGLLAPALHALDIRGSIQILDPMTGQLVTQALRLAVTGEVKGFEPGKLEPGKPMASTCEVEVAKLSIFLGGVPIIELDKFCGVFKVNGFDYLKSVRSDLGKA